MAIKELLHLIYTSQAVEVVCPQNDCWDRNTVYSVDMLAGTIRFDTTEDCFVVTEPIQAKLAVYGQDSVNCLSVVDKFGIDRYIRFLFTQPLVQSGGQIIFA